MRDVHRNLLEEKVLEWAYGSVINLLNNYCEEFVRITFINVVNHWLFVSKTIYKKILLLKLFYSVFADKYGKSNAMVLYYNESLS